MKSLQFTSFADKRRLLPKLRLLIWVFTYALCAIVFIYIIIMITNRVLASNSVAVIIPSGSYLSTRVTIRLWCRSNEGITVYDGSDCLLGTCRRIQVLLQDIHGTPVFSKTDNREWPLVKFITYKLTMNQHKDYTIDLSDYTARIDDGVYIAKIKYYTDDLMSNHIESNVIVISMAGYIIVP